MILEVDFGNTRIKWRLMGPRLTGAESGHARSVSSFVAELQKLPKPAEVRVASVRKGDSLAEFSDWLEQNWGLSPRLARVTRQCAGVTNSYADVSRMGVDRWLAMLSAYSRAQGACIVVDGGTALTIDALDANGRHIGGYILPGLTLMAASLEANTGIRLRETDDEVACKPGNSTEQAVRNGALATVIALIEKTHSTLAADRQAVATYLSGGDAPVLLSCLHALGDVSIVPDLVLDGLVLACPDAAGDSETEQGH